MPVTNNKPVNANSVSNQIANVQSVNAVNNFDFLQHNFNTCPIVATANGKTFAQCLHNIRSNEWFKHFYLSNTNKNTSPDELKKINDTPLNGELCLYLYDGVLMCSIGDIAIYSRSPSVKYPFATCPTYKNAIIEIFKFLVVPPTMMFTPNVIASYLISQCTAFPFSKSFLNFTSLYGEAVFKTVNEYDKILPFTPNVTAFKFPTADVKAENNAVKNGLKPANSPTVNTTNVSSVSPTNVSSVKPVNSKSSKTVNVVNTVTPTINNDEPPKITENVGEVALDTMIKAIYTAHSKSTDKATKRILAKNKTADDYCDTIYENYAVKNGDSVSFSDYVATIYNEIK